MCARSGVTDVATHCLFGRDSLACDAAVDPSYIESTPVVSGVASSLQWQVAEPASRQHYSGREPRVHRASAGRSYVWARVRRLRELCGFTNESYGRSAVRGRGAGGRTARSSMQAAGAARVQARPRRGVARHGAVDGRATHGPADRVYLALREARRVLLPLERVGRRCSASSVRSARAAGSSRWGPPASPRARRSERDDTARGMTRRDADAGETARALTPLRDSLAP
jgi:hypothetical protein